MMLLIQTPNCKFLASWKGLYEMVEWVSLVNYCVRQPGRHQEEQLYHINLLKCWIPPPGELMA